MKFLETNILRSKTILEKCQIISLNVRHYIVLKGILKVLYKNSFKNLKLKIGVDEKGRSIVCSFFAHQV